MITKKILWRNVGKTNLVLFDFLALVAQDGFQNQLVLNGFLIIFDEIVY